MNITNDIKYIGVNDHNIDLFEGQYVVPNGMAYNSYVILDEQICVMDTVDQNFVYEWLNNLEKVLEGKSPNYLVVSHMEPDHSAGIIEFVKKYPNAKVIGNTKTFKMISQFFNYEIINKIVVNDKDEINLGKHILTFVFAPMVHWPEVMVTYDNYDKVLFSADAFGKFGALDVEEDWACEARRYYFGIVGMYGVQAQSLLKKVSMLDINSICPLHGPVLNENLDYYFNLYNIWTTYASESEGVMIAYTSIYGNTKKAALMLEQELRNLGCQKVVVCDLARDEMSEAVEDAFRYPNLVLATTTYNGSVFPFMNTFIETLIEHKLQNKRIGIIGNGTWANLVDKVIIKKFETTKNNTILDNKVSILSSINDKNVEEIKLLAKELMQVE
jgi:flavorubredoxin